jgi:ribokinase
MGTVCIVGSLNIDLVTLVEAHPRPGETVRGVGLSRLPGGKGANQALAAARAGARTLMCGRIGEDDLGDAYRKGLASRGVDCSGVIVVPGVPSGHALIAVDSRGENSIIVIAGANGELTDIGRHSDAIASADVLLLQLEIPLPSVLAAAELARRNNVRVMLNPSPWMVPPPELLAIADPLIVNEHEAAQLPRDVRSLCITLGERGVRWGELNEPAPRGKIVDTTGAGDAFAGTLAAAIANGFAPAKALQLAVAAGTKCCSWPGAQNWQL